MTSSRTILIEANRLFRQGLKHLLADTRFAVEAEFSTTGQAVDGDGCLGSGDVGESRRSATASGRLPGTPASSCWPVTSRWMPCATP